MAQVIIEMLRSAPYLRDSRVFMGADMDDLNADPKGLRVEPFSGRSTGTSKIMIGYSIEKGGYNWDTEYLPFEEFKELVPKCAIVGDNGNVIRSIDEINFFNRDEPFFNSDEMTVMLSRGRAVIDDALPRNKVIAAFFFADTERFVRVEGDEELVFSSELYSIGLVDNVEKARDSAAMSELNIGKRLTEMNREQLVVLAKLWDVNVKNNTSDDIVRGRIFDLVKKSPITLGPKSRAAWFNKYVNMTRDKIMLYDSFLDGRRSRLITMNDENLYIFNGIVLGRNEDESVEFLSLAMNEKTLKALREGIRFRKNKLTDDLDSYGEHVSSIGTKGRPKGKAKESSATEVITPDPESQNDLGDGDEPTDSQ